MRLYIHYDEAQRELDGKDLFAVRTLTAIHRSMLKNANSAMKPAFPFDMQYYYDSLVRSMAINYNHPVETVGSTVPNIFAVNIPDVSQSQWQGTEFVKTGKAQAFIELVRRESKQAGNQFDLSFACEIAADAFDATTLASIEDGIGKRIEPVEDQFDDWLQGFNASENSQ
jgi:broad specificity polyphosphatase/5'/3'-nucleotidase SurE